MATRSTPKTHTGPALAPASKRVPPPKPALKSAAPRRPAQERVVTTVRLEPGLHAEISALGALERLSFNQVMEAGMRHYVLQQRNRLEHKLERALTALRARPEPAEGEFDAAIARLVKSEAAHGADDPAQGRMTDTETAGATVAPQRR